MPRNDEIVFQLIDIDEEWLAEYTRRSTALNKVLDEIHSGRLTEEQFWADPSYHDTIVRGLEYQTMFRDPLVPGQPGFIRQAPPLVEGEDYVIETRSGSFGVYATGAYEAKHPEAFIRPEE